MVAPRRTRRPRTGQPSIWKAAVARSSPRRSQQWGFRPARWSPLADVDLPDPAGVEVIPETELLQGILNELKAQKA